MCVSSVPKVISYSNLNKTGLERDLSRPRSRNQGLPSVSGRRCTACEEGMCGYGSLLPITVDPSLSCIAKRL